VCWPQHLVEPCLETIDRFRINRYNDSVHEFQLRQSLFIESQQVSHA